MPGALDLALALLLAVAWPLYNLFVQWPNHVRAVAAGDAGARTRLYRGTLVEQWLLTGAVVALTVWAARSPLTLGLAVPHGWRLWLGAGLPLLYGGLALAQVRALVARPETLARLRATMHALRPLVPHTAREWAWFRPLAVTAGVCEELLFRGYLVWVLAAWIGLLPAAAVSVAIFGAAHAYQGRQFAVRASLAGLFMGVLALVTGSVLPGMALHAAVDLAGGYAAYLALRAEASAAS